MDELNAEESFDVDSIFHFQKKRIDKQIDIIKPELKRA